MNRDKIIKMLSLHEGRVPHAYQDSLGYWTIGVGHLIDKRKGGRLPEHIIDALLDWDAGEKWQELLRRAPWVEDLDDVRQAVLLDMAFNLGVTGLLKFKNTLKAVRAGDWDAAAAGMMNSLWAKQVKTRAVRLAHMMRTGEWADV